MKIGELVQNSIGAIIEYCNNVKHEEFENLKRIDYSKKTFDINFPFFIEVADIDESNTKKQRKRFYGKNYLVRGKIVRVTSQWYEYNKQSFLSYLRGIDIKINQDVSPILIPKSELAKPSNPSQRTSGKNSRYKSSAIGNASNLFIRNVLCNLGKETFNEQDWEDTKKYFDYKCAYCSASEALLMDHIIPINKERLGEHRLGNIVPSCRKCNQEKADKDYRDFLGDHKETIKRIEQYMESRNYVPLEDNEQLRKILNLAYDEVSALADRYIAIVNQFLLK